MRLHKGITLNRSDLRHIIAKHGNAESEALRGQINITPKNFSQIIDTIADPDKVRAEVNEKSGLTSVIFVKENNGVTTAVSVLSEKKKALTLKSAWIINKKRSTSPTPDAEAPRSTSETGRRIKTTSNNKYSTKFGKVNRF